MEKGAEGNITYYAHILVLPHIPHTGKQGGIRMELDQDPCPRGGDLGKVYAIEDQKCKKFNSKRRGFNLQLCSKVENSDQHIVKSLPSSPPCPHGGRWGKTLIGALLITTLQCR